MSFYDISTTGSDFTDYFEGRGIYHTAWTENGGKLHVVAGERKTQAEIETWLKKVLTEAPEGALLDRKADVVARYYFRDLREIGLYRVFVREISGIRFFVGEWMDEKEDAFEFPRRHPLIERIKGQSAIPLPLQPDKAGMGPCIMGGCGNVGKRVENSGGQTHVFICDECLEREAMKKKRMQIQKKWAKNGEIDLEELKAFPIALVATKLGLQLVKEGAGVWAVKDPDRANAITSIRIFDKTNTWKRFSGKTSGGKAQGDVISLVQHVRDCDFKEACSVLKIL